jgi:CPA1 family monovalent cation:H+ antiporter
VISLAVTAARFAFVFPLTYVPRMFLRRFRERPAPDPRVIALLGWSGLRGSVSMAAALALPTTLPDRDLIIFCAYAVILFTLVGQGLTLGPLIERMRVYDDEESVAEQEAEARLRAAEAALERLGELEGEDWIPEDTLDRMRRFYDFRSRRFQAQLDSGDDGEIERGSQAYQRLRRKVLEAERAEIIRLRNRGSITDETMRRIERDLDLEDARLET